MKEPLLNLNPAPEADPGVEQPGLEESIQQEEVQDLHYRTYPSSLPEAEPLIDPLMLSAPARLVRRKKIPVVWVNLGLIGTAVLLTGILLGMKISDYYHGRYFEKRFAKLFDVPDLPAESHLSARPAASREPAPAPLAAVVDSAPSVPPSAISNPMIPEAPAPRAAASAAASMENPDLKGELEALRQERQLVSQRFEQVNSGRGETGSPSLPSSVPGKQPASRLPSSAPSFGKLGSAGAAASGSQLTTEEQRIRDAPAIARVLKYDSDWHFVVLDGGKERNIVAGTQLAVRRAHQILGLIKVDEVEDKESVAELQGKWRLDPQFPKPQRGDDVVTYPMF